MPITILSISLANDCCESNRPFLSDTIAGLHFECCKRGQHVITTLHRLSLVGRVPDFILYLQELNETQVQASNEITRLGEVSSAANLLTVGLTENEVTLLSNFIIIYLMDLINQSERSQCLHKQLGNLRVTNATSAFKSTSRETGANWANRINKDFNDLTYNVGLSQFKEKDTPDNQFHIKTKRRIRNMSTKLDEKPFDKHLFRLELIKMNKASNPEKIHLSEQEKYSTLNTQGLCKFQFDNTIAGRLRNRGHRHLDFRNQTMRQIYTIDSPKRDEVTSEEKSDASYRHRKIESSKNHRTDRLNRCHDFKSYSPRKVFEGKEELDKIYDTDHYFTVIRARRTKQTARMSGLIGRKQDRPKQSSTLAYEEYESRKFIMNSAKSYEVSKSARRTELGKEVISPKRGCYR